ncbi:MAG: hypothetical protein GX902_01310 [Lentisphaerae bacterium]|jgi:hypothetical protein|nr:hypothetical protein [Lentisphaerota bacterium]
MRMHRIIACTVLSLTVLGLTATVPAQETPRQFRVWGRKAPAKLGGFEGIANQYGLESIKIPSGYKRITPETNLQDPEAPAEFAALGYLPFPNNAMQYIYPETRPFPEEIGRPVRAFATPGEFVPLAFSLRSLKNLHCVEVSVSPYRDRNGQIVIPGNHLDLRIVRDLPIPEKEENQYMVRPKYLESFDEFDILNIPAGRTERFWLTVKVPEGAAAGTVRASINIKCRLGGEYTWESMIRILPFTLAVPDPEKDINFQILSNTNDPRFGSYGRDCNPSEIQRIFVDMAEHGMVSNNYEHVHPHISKGESGKLQFDFDRPGMTSIYSFNDYMYMVLKSGLTGPFCYYNGPYEASQYLVSGLLKYEKYSPEYNDALRQIFAAIEAHREKMSWPEFIYFIGDEPGSHAERLRLNLNCGQQIKAVKPTARISNFFNGEWNGTKDWKLLKEVSDINCTNYINENTLQESRELGYESVWGYNGCYNHALDTRGERVFYGFHPWRCQLKGITQYKYRAFYADLKYKGSVAYNPFCRDGGSYDYTYPSAEGPIPTPKWESVRQGIYDYRYLLTLQRLLDKNPNHPAAAAGKEAMAEVMANFHLDYQSPSREKYFPLYSPETLDVYRWKIAQAILGLQK